MKKLLACILSTISCFALADNREWTQEEKAWGYTALALSTIDWAQTRDLTKRYNEGFYERNPVLGRYPSTGQVNMHFALGIPVMLLVADNLDGYRKSFLQTVSMLELICVGNNISIGLRMRF